MLSFRNRLLILLIGLVVGAQTVTLITALARTAASERNRADKELARGAASVTQQLEYRERQLANAVDVLVKDYGLRKLFSSHESVNDRDTLASALGNYARRIGAQLSLALDVDGKLITQGEGTADIDAQQVAAFSQDMQQSAGGAQFVTLPTGVYQVFTAPTLDENGQVALGIAVDGKLAEELHSLVAEGVEVAFLTGTKGKQHLLTGTLPAQTTAGVIAVPLGNQPLEVAIGGVQYLATATHLSGGESTLDIALLKPMSEVNKPFYLLAWDFARIFGFTLAAAVLAGVYLGRSAARPVQRLAAGAARIAAGDYSLPVEASGGQELAHLADSFNSMQSGIAERETRLMHVARHDSATGLPNRVQLEEWLTQRLQSAATPRITIVQLAVTNLQEISATLGFEIAERLVSHLAQQLTAWNNERGMVARLDTAAFAVALELQADQQATDVATVLQEYSSAPFTTAGISLQANVVLGVALAPRDGATAVEALRCAHAAVEAANLQRCNMASFALANDEAQRRRLTLGADLPQALTGGQLYLHFQPKVRMADRNICGVEALLRWQHPVFGNVSPAEFIPIAERTGASAGLTRWVLQTALKQLAAWHRDGYPLEVAVNLSAADILDVNLLQHILEALRKQKVPAGALTLEITESVLMHEPEAARRNMELLRVAGVRFSIDDFGTGYSSLSQLRELAADELKIDQSFVRGKLRGPEQIAVLSAIIELANGFGLRTVAEGVETEEQWRLLADLGCHHAQGYLISRPVAAAELEPLLRVSTVQPADHAEKTQSLRVLELRRRES